VASVFINAVVREILKIMNKDESLIEFVEDGLGHDIRYSLDSSELMELGWRLGHPFEDALRLTVEWYLKMNGGALYCLTRSCIQRHGSSTGSI